MMHYSHSQMALLTVISMLGIACTEGPTDSAGELTGPEFAKGGKRKPAGDPSITVTFADPGNNVTSDGRGSYVDGECGVKATFNINDARLDPDAKKINPKNQGSCGGRDPRKVMVAFTDLVGGSQPGGRVENTVGANFFKVNVMEQVTVADETVLRTAVIHGAGCAHGLRFNLTQESDSDEVEVTKNDDGTWTVAAEAPNDVAVCIPDEDGANPPPRSYYHMSFSITVTLN